MAVLVHIGIGRGFPCVHGNRAVLGARTVHPVVHDPHNALALHGIASLLEHAGDGCDQCVDFFGPVDLDHAVTVVVGN